MNESTFTHQVYPDQIDTDVEHVKENQTVPNQQTNDHRLKKRHASSNATADSKKDSYVIVPSSKKRTLKGSGDNRRINVVVHNITSLANDDSRLVDDIKGDSVRYMNRNLH